MNFGKFLSRRFLMTAAVLGLETIGVNVPVEVVGLVGAYVLGESGTDAARVFNHKVPLANRTVRAGDYMQAAREQIRDDRDR